MQPTVYSYRRQWNPCHMDYGLVFQQAIDRQDRTPAEGRFSYWNYMETSLQPVPQEYSTGQGLVARRHAL